MSRILTRSQYLDTLRNQAYTRYTGVETNEAFSNDVNWGDSWVGRMINSIIRKGKVAVNLRRIDSLGKRLESLFDDLVESGKIVADNSTKSFITTSCLLGQLEDMVKGKKGDEGTEEDIPNIISHITFLIGQVQGYNLRDKDELIDVLNEFMKYLEELLKKQGNSEDDETGDEDEVGDKESKEIGDPNQIFFQESKKFLQSVVDLHNMIKNNVVRFSEEEYGKKFNVGVQFDLAKFNSLKTTYEKANPENKLSILRQLVPMIEVGLDSYKVKKDKTNITLFDSYFKKYAGILSGMERDSLDKNKKKETPLDDLKNLPKVEKTPTPTKKSVDEIAKELEKKWIASQISQGKNNTKPGQGTRDRFEKEAKRIANESILFEEVEQNLEKGENHARNAWKKVVDAYNKSGVTKYIPQIEELLSTGIKDGKEKVIQAKKNIILVCKQILANKSTVGKPIAFDDLIKEGLYDNDMPKAISLFGKVLLSFNEDLGLAGAYGSRGRDASGKPLGTNPLKVFVESFNTLEKTLPKLGGSKKSEYKSGDIVKYKLSKGGEGEKEIIKIEGDRFFFKSKDGNELSAPLKSITGKVEKKQESVITKYDSFRKLFEKTEGVDYDEVSNKFDELFTTEIIDKFQIEESTIEEIKKSGKEGDTIVITGADPIMEIVRLFQRAWRMHTPGIIPSGRTGGKVSTSVFMEYENLGDRDGTPDSPGSGPYRNIELYEKWNEAVTNILSNTKYRTTIFSDDAKFAWEYGPPLSQDKKTERAKMLISKSNFVRGAEDGEVSEISKPLGKILLRFINSLLTDTEMYKKNGALPKFLQEYFGLGDDQVKELGGLNYGGPFSKDGEKNAGTTKNMPIQTVCKFVERVVIKDFINNPDILKFISDKVKSNEVSDIKNMLIKIITDDNPVYLLFLGIRGTDKNKLYFLMLDSMYFDVDNFRMGTADLTTRPTKLDLIEIATSENLIATTEFDFTKWSLLSDDRTSGENSKIKPKKIQILVNRNEDVFLDLKMRRLDREFKIVNRIKKQKGNLL
jgi:hypothetical protein